MSRRVRAQRPAGPLMPAHSTPSESVPPVPGVFEPARRAVRVGVTGLVIPAVALGLVALGGTAADAHVKTADDGGGTSPTVLATTVGGFVDSVGVNTHTSFAGTAYGNTGRVVSLLQGLGVRHVRDGLTGVKQQTNALSMLGAAGIDDDALIGANSMTDPTVSARELAEADQLAPYLDSIEPTNEADCTRDPNWVKDLHNYSHNLANAVRSDPALSSVPLLGPAFCRPESVAQYGSAADDSDISNAHDYSRGQIPELPFESRLPGFGAVQNPGKPQVVTEFGFHDGGVAKGAVPAVTQATAADYDVRALLDGKRLGLKRTYIYELMDETPTEATEEHYGLVNYDGTPKPAYTAVQNLLSDISNGNPAATAGTPATAQVPAVTLSGGGSLLRTLQIGDSDGNGETVALWLDTPLDNLTTNTRLPDTDATVDLQIAGGAAATAQQPSRGNTVTSLGSGTSFDVPVDGAVTLVHLDTSSPATAATAPAALTNYTDRAAQLGATVSVNLTPGPSWIGSPGATAVPGAGTPGSVIDAANENEHVSVPGTSSSWTIAMWERTDPTSQSMADFLHVTKARGGKLRTYDLTNDTPSHNQISGMGLPLGNASYGTGGSANAMPGTWHMVSLSQDATTATFAVDGITSGTMPSTGVPLTNGIDIGSLSPGFRGGIAGLEVFPTALGQDQLVSLATATASAGSSSNSSTSAGGGVSARYNSTLSSYVPQQVYQGHSATLITRLMSQNGALAGCPVQLTARTVGSTVWTNVSTQNTGPDGIIRFDVSPTVPTDYRWSFNGTTLYASSTSDTHRMTVLTRSTKSK